MTIERQWPQIRTIFEKATTLVVASIGAEGYPHMTPIGTLCLRDDCTGYYLEHFPVGLAKNVERDDRVEVYALNGKPGTWLSTLIRGRFTAVPGGRLRGRASARREATPEERERWARKVRRLRWTKGHDLLWSNMRHARDIRFEAFEPIRFGVMTAGLWDAAP